MRIYLLIIGVKTMKKRFHIIMFILTVLLVLGGCEKETGKKDIKEENPVNVQTSGEEVAESEANFAETVRSNKEKEQTYLLQTALKLEKENIVFGGTSVVIDGGEKRAEVQMFSNSGFAFQEQDQATELLIKNVDFVNKKLAGGTRIASYVHAFATNVVYENCTFLGGVAVYGNAKFINCTFDETDSLRYCIFVDNEHGIYDAMQVELENCTFNGHDTAYGLVKVADDSEVGATLKVKDCQFSNIVNKAAVYVNGTTVVTTEGKNTYTKCAIGAILAKGSKCVLNNQAMIEGQSYEE